MSHRANKTNVDIVRRWFSYDPIAGTITRKLKGRSSAPDILNPRRQRVDLLGVRYRVTHIIWAIYYGKWPNEYIDHIDHDICNNRIANLREATHAENCRNRLSSNPYGKGVTYRADRRECPWQAQIMCNTIKIQLGFFETSEEAVEAYKQAAIKYHGEFACLT